MNNMEEEDIMIKVVKAAGKEKPETRDRLFEIIAKALLEEEK
jgi:hypothetical protein|tara:strand:+ start:322 stop:447 length:126 start_codon:yes stop_codon:yes gene_type:complete